MLPFCQSFIFFDSIYSQAAIRFHRIDTNQNGYICCDEAFRWNKDAFRSAAERFLSSDSLKAAKGIQEKSNPCPVLKKYDENCKNKKEMCWPSLLVPPLMENENSIDGRITPDEFDAELGNLKKLGKLEQMMQNVKEKPMIRKI